MDAVPRPEGCDMRSNVWRGMQRARLLGAALLCGVLAGCNGSSSVSSRRTGIFVFPLTATVWQGATQDFSANSQGTLSSTPVTWSVQEGAAGGTISSAGSYTAPEMAGTYHVVAISQADSSVSATATVTVPAVSAEISPGVAAVGLNQQRQFSATVTGTVKTVEVSWSVLEGAPGGTITKDGLYTAPSTAGTYHVELTGVPVVAAGEATVTVVSSGYFHPTASMGTGRADQTATLLPNGKVLIAGGRDGSTPLRTAELFDPATDTFSPTGDMAQARRGHTATLLADGKVLIAGGRTALADVGGQVTGTAELYDPATGTFTATGDMTFVRAGFTATLLDDGRVLMVGGGDAELYDPATGTFSLAAVLPGGAYLYGHAAVRLSDGKVLLAGGEDGFDVLDTAMVYDPASGLFTVVGNMTAFREYPTLSLLADGKVLAAGGMTDGDSCFGCEPIRDVDVYDPAGAGFSATGKMQDPHGGHTATVLPDGKVLIAGGKTFAVELYDPGSGTFALGGSLATERTFHTATLLKDGRVLVTGGYDGARNPLPSAEIYQ
jgi:hypothetical protein